MTIHTDPPLMSAQHDPTTTSTTRARGEGVKAVKIFSDRNDRRRAWDEMSEIDRAVLLEGVRQRREAQERRRSIQAGLNASRQIR